MKILMITTGGTLACTPTENGLAPTMKGRDILNYAKDRENIDICDYELIDSSLMTDEERGQICRVIWQNRDKYDGFIVTHGTDSLAYTGAYIDCALNNFGKTIVLTGAQLPLGVAGTDAADNLNLAINVAKSGYFGTCLAIGGKVIPAKTATKTDTENFTAFESVTGEYLDKPLTAPENKAKFLSPKYKVGLI
jgi:L-asparaginase